MNRKVRDNIYVCVCVCNYHTRHFMLAWKYNTVHIYHEREPDFGAAPQQACNPR